MGRLGLLLTLTTAIFLSAVGAPTVLAEPVFREIQLQAPANLTVGDQFTYIVTLEGEEGTQLSLAPEGLPPWLTLVGPPAASSTPRNGGRAELRLSLRLAAFAPGELTVPPLRLVYTEPAGASGVVETPESLLTVRSVLPASGQITPRDLKPQAEVGSPPGSLLLPAGAGVLVALALLTLAVWRLRSRRRSRPAVVLDSAPAVLTIEDLARAELDAAAVDFVAAGDYVAYYLKIALTVRNYLSARFGFPAFALTTRELQDAMIEDGVDRWQARLASGLLSQCDAVVYASYRPAAERADADLTAAYEIVEMSRPAVAREGVALT